MTKKTKKKVQTCGACGRAGHNKRRCLEVSKTILKIGLEKKTNKKKDTKKKSTNSAITKKAKKKKSPIHVFVNTHSGPQVSEHFVDLRKEKKIDTWSGVNSFQEKKHRLSEKRLSINFADMVKEANKKSKIKNTKKNRFIITAPKLTTRRKIKVRKNNKNIFAPLASVIRVFKNITIPKINFDLPRKFFSNLFSVKLKRIPIRIPRSDIRVKKIFTSPRLAYGILTFLIIFSLPFPAIGYYNKVKENSTKVVDASSNAFLSLQSSTLAALHSDISQAQQDLNQALSLFSEAESIIDREHHALVYMASMLPIIGKQIKDRQHILNAGHHVALGNTYLVKGISDAEKTEDISMTERFQILKRHLRSARPQYQEALESFTQVNNSSIPAEYQQSFEDFKLLFAIFIDDMDDFVDLIDMLHILFGGEDFQRTLVMFQNHHEIRPSGGFLGSFAIIDTQKGKIMNIEVPGGGSYDLQGQLTEYIAPPLPLQLVNDRWEFQDSNWFFDFPTTANSAEWFVENSRGITFDNVVAINASVIERLLSVVGVVENEKYDVLLDSNNVLETLQYSVEVDYDKEENKPKQILADLFDQFLDLGSKLDGQKIIGLLGEFNQALNEKEIQIYSHDESAQNRLGKFGWSGEMFPTGEGQDYLAVVNTNLQGKKSDARIIQDIDHQSVVLSDGAVENTVKIRREHTGEIGEMFYGGPNINYIRIYVPEGAILLDAGGFEYPPEEAFHVPESWYGDPELEELEDGYHLETGTRVTREFGKTVFGNWMVVEPGEVSEVVFTYRLPFSVIEDNTDFSKNENKWRDVFIKDKAPVSKYQMFVQKQSGSVTSFSSQVIYPENWSLQWRTDEGEVVYSNAFVLEKELDSDFNYALVMKKDK